MPRRVVLYGEREEFEIVCDACELIGVAIAPAMLAHLRAATPALTASVTSGVRFMPPGIAAALRHTVSRALVMAEVPERASAGRREALGQQLARLVLAIAALPDASGRRRCTETHTRVVASAKRIIHAQLPGPTVISELCRRIGVSRRNLFYSFEAVLGTSPHQYLKSVRLDSVRRALKQQKPGGRYIADLAWDAGFQSPSHFAADYKHRFGELPSQTSPRCPS